MHRSRGHFSKIHLSSFSSQYILLHTTQGNIHPPVRSRRLPPLPARRGVGPHEGHGPRRLDLAADVPVQLGRELGGPARQQPTGLRHEGGQELGVAEIGRLLHRGARDGGRARARGPRRLGLGAAVIGVQVLSCVRGRERERCAIERAEEYYSLDHRNRRASARALALFNPFPQPPPHTYLWAVRLPRKKDAKGGDAGRRGRGRAAVAAPRGVRGLREQAIPRKRSGLLLLTREHVHDVLGAGLGLLAGRLLLAGRGGGLLGLLRRTLGGRRRLACQTICEQRCMSCLPCTWNGVYTNEIKTEHPPLSPHLSRSAAGRPRHARKRCSTARPQLPCPHSCCPSSSMPSGYSIASGSWAARVRGRPVTGSAAPATAPWMAACCRTRFQVMLSSCNRPHDTRYVIRAVPAI